jgi:hypothetical protein
VSLPEAERRKVRSNSHASFLQTSKKTSEFINPSGWPKTDGAIDSDRYAAGPGSQWSEEECALPSRLRPVTAEHITSVAATGSVQPSRPAGATAERQQQPFHASGIEQTRQVGPRRTGRSTRIATPPDQARSGRKRSAAQSAIELTRELFADVEENIRVHQAVRASEDYFSLHATIPKVCTSLRLAKNFNL